MDGRELTTGRRRNFQGHRPPQCNGSHAGDREHKTHNIGSDCLDDPRLLQVPDIGRDTEPAFGVTPTGRGVRRLWTTSRFRRRRRTGRDNRQSIRG